MKKYLNVLLCTFILLLSIFALTKVDNKIKVEYKNEEVLAANIDDFNTIKKENNNREKDEKEKQEKLEREKLEKEKENKKETTIVKTSTTKKSVQNNSSTNKANNVNYGTFGRLYVSGFSVALYDYNVNTYSSTDIQTIVNNTDSAAYYENYGKLVIADHNYQGFSVLVGLGEGATSYIRFKDGSTIRYRLIKKSRGVNTGPDLKDTNGNSFYNMKSDLIMYTCYEDGIMATLWVLA